MKASRIRTGMRRSGRLEKINRELRRLRERPHNTQSDRRLRLRIRSRLMDYGNDSGKSKGLKDLIMPATEGETCYTNSRH